MQSKGNTVTLSIQTSHFGTGASNKQAGTSFGKKVAHKLDRIENNPLAVSVTLLFVYRELLPSMIDVGPVTAWELFKTLCTGTAVAEFNEILFNASRRAFLVIDSEFNKKICDAPDDTGTEVQEWIKKNEKRKEDRQGYPLPNYDFSFPPSKIPPPPERASKDKLVKWNPSGIQGMDALAWLNLHKHGWEFAELLHDLVMIEIKDLAFRGFGKEAGRVQISYLTEDLLMDPSHNLSTFLRLLEWFSEAQLLYPKVQGDDEVGKLFTSTRKTLILWNYAYESFKDEINNMNKTRPTDFATFKAAKEAFLLAEERKNAKQKDKAPAKPDKPKPKPESDKNKGKRGSGKESSSNKSDVTCGYCNKVGHLSISCFKNPKSENYKGDKKPPKDEKNKKRPFSDLNMAEQFEQFNKFLKAQDGYLSE